jgi:hypothetical protein
MDFLHSTRAEPPILILRIGLELRGCGYRQTPPAAR